MAAAKVASPKFSVEEASALYAKAHSAGEVAAEQVVPVPMHVVERANPFDDNSPIVKRYAPVMDGPCGFGWVRVVPGNSSFANYLKKAKGCRAAYGGGVSLWVSEYGQSYVRKYAYARAFAGVLQEAGVTAYGEGRLD